MDNWIPKCDIKERYEDLLQAYNDFVDMCYNDDVITEKNLHTKDDYLRAINILKDRLHIAKQSHRETITRLKNEVKYYQHLYELERDEKFKAQRHEYPSEGLIYFSDSIRNYFIQGLEVIKNKFLYETMPDKIKYETDEHGEYVEAYNENYNCMWWKERPEEESKAEWGKLIEKMIKALKYKSKYSFDPPPEHLKDKIDKETKEGIDLFIKYSDSLWY